MRITIGLALAVASLIGCAAEERAPCRGDDGVSRWVASSDWTVEEREALERSAARWNAFAGRKVVAVGEDKDACAITRARAQLVTPTGVVSNAVLWPDDGRIEVSPTYKCAGDASMATDPACLELLVMHEIGHHLLGPEHLADETSGIMQGSRGVPPDFTGDDRALCVARGVCR